jgi:hypothetical protein
MEQCVIVGITDTGSILDIVLVLVHTNLRPQGLKACRDGVQILHKSSFIACQHVPVRPHADLAGVGSERAR